jgi:predicted MFS family arabinose efflux permease
MGSVTSVVSDPVATNQQGSGRLLAALCVASFLAALNFFATAPFYPVMARDLDTTVPLLGQVTTLMILVSTVLGLAVGPIADRYGYRRPLVIGVLAVALNLVGIGLAPSYPVLLVLSVAGGLADALVYGLPLAIAGIRFSGAAQRKAMGWTIGALSSASIVGTPVLTSIGSVAGWRVALVSAGVVAAAAAWFIFTSLPADERRPTARFRMAELTAAYLPLIRHRPTLRLYGTTVLRAVTWVGLITYLGAYLADELGLGTRNVGFIYMASGIGYAVGSVAGAKVLAFSPRLVVAASCLFGGLTVGAMMMVTSIVVTIALVVTASLISALAGIGVATVLANESPAGTGTTMVLNGSMMNLGSAGGALLGGVLISVGGYSALGLGLPLFSVLAALLAWWPSRPART